MRFLISILLFLSLTNVCSAQEQSMLFEKVWGTNDECGLYYADELPNGDYILVGGQKSTLYPPGVGLYENYICRVNFRGNIIWEKQIGDPYAMDNAGGITKTSWGSYLLIGTTWGGTLTGYEDVSAWNIDADGNVLFEKYFTSGIYNNGGDVTETPDSCFVFLCRLGIPFSSSQVPGMIKIDRYGNEIWRHRQDTLGGAPYLIQQTIDSGFIVVGGGAAANNSYYAKYKPDGNMDWIKYPFGLLPDTIPNSPTVLRSNADGTFDIYYATYPVTWDSNVYGLFKHYDPQGNCLSTKKYFDPFLNFFSCDNSDSAIWAISVNGTLNILNEDTLFDKILKLNGVDTLNRGIYEYIKTSDGGYLGVGQYNPDPQNGYATFYIAKFGADGRYQPDEFSESVNAYPNPSTDGNITLTFDMTTDDNVQVDIYTAEGKLVYSSSVFCPANSHTEKPIRLDELSVTGGMYILQARTADAVIRKKLIVSSKPQ